MITWKKVLIIALIVIAVVLIAIAVYFIVKKRKENKNKEESFSPPPTFKFPSLRKVFGSEKFVGKNNIDGGNRLNDFVNAYINAELGKN